MAERLLNDSVTKQVREAFDKQLTGDVQVIYFGTEKDCDYCDDTRQLVEEVVQLSDKLNLSVHDLENDRELANKYNLDKAPGLVIAGRDGDLILDYGIRMAGIPSGYEFGTFIQSLILVSGRDSGLAPKTRKALGDLKNQVNLLVFTTPT